MEAHQNDHHQQAAAAGEGQLGGGKNNNNSTGSSGGFMCRQSSSRWTPTSEQIRILKDLYYNNGVRSPTAEQIQRISAKLRQYGKIEGKNVFYWFQNHKARERQKKRFTTTNADHHHQHQHHIAIPSRNHHDHHLLLHHHHHHLSSIYNNNNNNNKHLSNHPAPGNHLPSSSSSPGLLTVGNYGYGSLAMEKSFRDYCSISPSGGNGGGGHNFAWVGVDSSSSSSSSSSYPYPFIDKRKYTTSTNDHHQTLEILEGDEEEEEEEALPEIETLPLFPIHGQVKHQEINYFNGWRADDVAASLELTLNSYAPTSSSFPTS